MKRYALTEDEEKRTVWIMGKPYHWTLVDGALSLQSGITEYEQIRLDVFARLLARGLTEDQISKQMIEDIIANAEDRAIKEAVSE